MTKLSDSLKQMLSGLAYQDAGDYLSMSDKMEVLGYGAKSRLKPSLPHQSVAENVVTRRIALITDGRGVGAPLDYAIEACLQQGGKIDLLIHGAVDTSNIITLESRIREAGLECQRIRLSVEVIEDILAYTCNHSSLIFLVAIPDDSVAKRLIDEITPKRKGRLSVPLVLIEDRPSDRTIERSAA
ncbi:MAG: hypothetical protein ABW166_15875 [Sedimenticola sp.]